MAAGDERHVPRFLRTVARNGHRSNFGHGGDTVSFHSNLHLILDANVGLFVSYNSAGRGEIDPRGLLFTTNSWNAISRRRRRTNLSSRPQLKMRKVSLVHTK